MAIPNGAGGYQVGDGNLGEVTLSTSAISTAYTAGVTLTTADLADGLYIYRITGTDREVATGRFMVSHLW